MTFDAKTSDGTFFKKFSTARWSSDGRCPSTKIYIDNIQSCVEMRHIVVCGASLFLINAGEYIEPIKKVKRINLYTAYHIFVVVVLLGLMIKRWRLLVISRVILQHCPARKAFAVAQLCNIGIRTRVVNLCLIASQFVVAIVGGAVGNCDGLLRW